jgi:transposase
MTKTLVSTNSSTLAFAGIDVGAAELMLVIRKNAVSMKVQKFANTPSDRLRLVKRLSKFPEVTVCLEASGVYHLIWRWHWLMPEYG